MNVELGTMEKLVNKIKLKLCKTLFPLCKGAGVGLLFLLGFVIARSENSEIHTIKRTQILMGTVVEIQVRDKDNEKAKSAISKAFKEIKRIDDLFSSKNEIGPVWKLNHEDISSKVIHEELFHLISFSDSICKISEGAFDVSLGNLIELWGFSSDKQKVPNKEILNKSLENSGWKNIRFDKSNRIKIAKHVKFDFGAVAKGYAVDKAIELIKQNGITAALVNAGGEVKGFGHGWVVGIQHPRNTNEILGKIKLNGTSVATSGDYEQYFEQNGKRYHHILNPKSGMPANECQSVTIICKENRTADALATAVFVLGKDKGMRLIESLRDVEAMIIDSHGNIFNSKGFTKYLLRS